MRMIIAAIYLVVATTAIAQSVEVVTKSNFTPGKKSRDLVFLETAIDTTQLQYVATIKASAKDNSRISDLFLKIKKHAQSLGANCFRLRDFHRDSSHQPELVLDTYFGNEAVLAANASNTEKNVVYIFCDDRMNNEKYSIKVDYEKIELKSGTYLKYKLVSGQELKLSKGGLSGATLWIEYKEDKPAVYITSTGFGIGGPVQPGTIGISFNTGRLNYMDPSLGHLLAQILTPVEHDVKVNNPPIILK